MGLSNKAVLVYLSISQWKGNKIDRRATGEVERNFATEGRVGNYTKKLLPDALELQKIDALAGSIRKWVISQTLPWMSDGTRILSAKNYFEFVQEFAKRKAAFESATDDFFREYQTLREAARGRLGALFNGLEYPNEDRLRGRFECNVRYMPLPEVEDFRTEVLESEKARFLNDLKSVETKAVADACRRLHDVVSKAVASLNDPTKIFRNSLIENIAEMTALLPKLNVTDDPQLDALRAETDALVSKISPDVVRENQNERVETAKKLADLESRMGAFMGALKGE